MTCPRKRTIIDIGFNHLLYECRRGRGHVEIAVSQVQQAVVLEVSGRVDSTTARELGEALSTQINSGRSRLVIDLAHVDYMSSAGLRELVMAYKRVGGGLHIAEPSPRVRELLEVTNLDSYFRIFDRRADAIASF